MWEVSDRFLDTIVQPHTMVAYVDVIAQDGTETRLPLSDGSVSIDRTATARYSCDVTVAAAYLASTLTDRLDIISPYSARMRVQRGVRYADGVEELFPLGYYLIDSVSWGPDESGMQINGTDMSVLVDNCPMVIGRVLSSNSTLSVISALLNGPFQDSIYDTPTAVDNLIVDSGVTDAALDSYTVEDDRWAAISDLALRLGAEVYADPDGGKWRVVPVPDPATAQSAWRVAVGPRGAIVGYDRSLSREAVRNCIVVRGDASDASVDAVLAIAEDTDPTSPTYVRTFGRAIDLIESSGMVSIADCQKAADALLASSRGLAATLNLSAVPNPALEAGDAITVAFDTGREELHMVDSLSIPLGPSGDYSLNTRNTLVRL